MTRRREQSLEVKHGIGPTLKLLCLLAVALSGENVMPHSALAVELKMRVVEQNAKQISLQYVLENSSHERVYVFDHLLYFDEKGATKYMDAGAHVFLDGESRVRVVRGIVPSPMFMSVARRPPILVSTLDPGASRGATIRLSLPLAESNPYFPAQVCDPKVAKPVASIRVEIGWIEHRDGMNIVPQKIDGKDFQRATGGWGAPMQRVARADVPVQGVTVCPYVGVFDRPDLAK